MNFFSNKSMENFDAGEADEDELKQEENMIDLLCHFNGYSNPFAIGTGSVITVPTVEEVEFVFGVTSDNNNKVKEELNSKVSKVDSNREYLNKTDITRSPPNVSNTQKRGYVENGRFIFANIIGNNKSNTIIETASEPYENNIVDYFSSTGDNYFN